MITRKGYVRLKAGPDRDMYEHRAVTKRAIEEFCPPPLKRKLGTDGLPSGFHVHHVNGNKRHNCRCNLQLLDVAIHDSLRVERVRARNRAFVLAIMDRTGTGLHRD